MIEQEKMCKYCDYSSKKCEIFQDALDGNWYLDVKTFEWDDVDNDYVHMKLYVGYCPYCGREL